MIHALTLTTLAGLSTGLGGLVVLLFRRPGAKLMAFSLGFAGGVMLTVSLADMLPHTVAVYSESMAKLPAALCAASLCLLGMLASALLERSVPDEAELGARAGRKTRAVPAMAPAGAPAQGGQAQCAGVRSGALRAAMVTTAAIVLHNLPEGILTLFTGYADPTIGLALTLAIALHNIPEGIAIAVPVYYATGSRGRGMLYALFSGLAEPAGALCAFLLLRDALSPLFLNGLIALIAGIMTGVSIGELVPDAFSYEEKNVAVAGLAVGILTMYVGIYLV